EVKTPAPVEITAQPKATFTPSVQLPAVTEESLVASTTYETPAPVKKIQRFTTTPVAPVAERETTITAKSYEVTQISSLREYGEPYVPTRSYSVIRVVLDEELANQKE